MRVESWGSSLYRLFPGFAGLRVRRVGRGVCQGGRQGQVLARCACTSIIRELAVVLVAVMCPPAGSRIDVVEIRGLRELGCWRLGRLGRLQRQGPGSTQHAQAAAVDEMDVHFF